MTTKCTAPVRGHRVAGSAANCPVHGRRSKAGPAATALPVQPHALTYESAVRIAQDPATPPDVLAEFAMNDEPSIVMFVAMNPRAPQETLTLLADHHHPGAHVRQRVASNVSTPPAVLELLSADRNEDVRCNVASNPSTPVHVIERFAEPVRGQFERLSAAQNPSLPGAVLTRLAQDPQVHVRDAALLAEETRICATFGIDADNTEAIESLQQQGWWTMSADSPAVVLAKTLYPNS